MQWWRQNDLLSVAGLTLLFAAASDGREFQTRLIATGLERPTGLAVQGNETLYFTQVPTPGKEGRNSVAKLDLATGAIATLHMGEPEPTNIAVDANGNAYWTCKSAGVILNQPFGSEEPTPLLTNLRRPSGISLDEGGNVFFTQVPEPGQMGGANAVTVFDGKTQTDLHIGDPEPTDVVVDKEGRLYWTCKSAGVIATQIGGETSVLVSGLEQPIGIALDERGEKLYWTEVPTPGMSGENGGRNRVSELDLNSKEITVVHQGDPEPTDVAVASNGDVYWTCSSAGVIVQAQASASINANLQTYSPQAH